MLPGERFERGDECFAVESRLEWGTVEIALVHYRRERAGRWHQRWSCVATLAADSFDARDLRGSGRYASHLEEAARHALDGELGGYVVVQALEGGGVRVRLIERRLADRELRTAILEDDVFDSSDPASLVASAERAEELRERARQLNDQAEAAVAEALEAAAAAFADRVERQRSAAELTDILNQETNG